MSIVVPGKEIGLLIEGIIRNFYEQTHRQIDRSYVHFSFIEARYGTLVGMQLRTIVADKHLKIRLYVQSFEYIENYRPFRLEVIKNSSPSFDDEVWVSYVVLPRTFFPALSKVRNQIPEVESEGVEEPFETSALITTSEIDKSGIMFYVTSQIYPFRADDLFPAVPIIQVSGELFYFTTQLYPIRGYEFLQSGPVVTESKLYRPAIVDEQLTTHSDVSHFLLGINPYSAGNYTITQQTGEQYEAMSILTDLIDFVNVQTFFPVDYQYAPLDLFVEKMTVLTDISDFLLVQTFFPVDYNYIRSSLDDDQLTIHTDITNFVLS